MRVAWFGVREDRFDFREADRSPTGQQLRTALQALGVELESVRTDDFDSAWVRKSRARFDAIHLNWLPSFYSYPTLPFGADRLPPFNRAARWLHSIPRFWRALRAARDSGIRVVWTMHNVMPHESSGRIDGVVRRIVTREVDAVIVPCPCARETLEERFGLARRIHVVRRGHLMDLYPDTVSREEARRALGLGSGTVYLFLGNVRPYKGLEKLVEAFAKIGDGDARLVIAGRCSDARLRDALLAATRGDSRYVLHLNPVPSELIQIYANAADVVVLPFTEVLNTASLQMVMGFGKVVVVPGLGCIPDIAGDGEFARFYDPQTPGALELAMLAARDIDPAVARESALRAVRARSWDITARQTVAAYRGEPAPDV